MALQTAVNTTLAPAVSGDRATLNQSVYTPVIPLAGEGGVTAGGFGWLQQDGTVRSAGSGAPSGFVERVLAYPDVPAAGAGSLTIPEGFPVTLAVRGDYWVQTTQSCSVGGQVYANQSTGAVEAVDSSETNVAASDWRFKTAGGANDMVIISNWN